ncbi:MAG: hypothetical protein RLW62_16235 [Gammaproteobacteria bacterium]
MPIAHKLVRYVSRRVCIDLGPREPAVFIAGMGRSGTTWVGELLNVDGRYRSVHEPFHVHEVAQVRALGRPGGQNLYVAPECDDATRLAAARRILAGRPWAHRRVNAFNTRPLCRARMIKEIRAILMLARRARPAQTDFRGRAARGEAAAAGWRGSVSPAQETRARRLLAATGFGWYDDDEPPAAGLWQGGSAPLRGVLAS